MDLSSFLRSVSLSPGEHPDQHQYPIQVEWRNPLPQDLRLLHEEDSVSQDQVLALEASPSGPSDLSFIRLVEHNEHEGETWSFWLQYTGNRDEIEKLIRLLHNWTDDPFWAESFEIDAQDMEPEHIVDKLVEYSDEGYMYSHNKVTGKFTCPPILATDTLYKGGIQDFFEQVV